MPRDQHKKNSGSTGADRRLTKEQFKNMSWEETRRRAIPIDKDEFIRKLKIRKEINLRQSHFFVILVSF
jgi:hypothetical protein